TMPAAATPTSSTDTSSRRGSFMSSRTSAPNRPGSRLIGIELPAPDTMNKPITATYVPMQRMHPVFSTKNDAQARYSTTASPAVERANTYDGVASASARVRESLSATISATTAKKMTPPSATGTPLIAP